MVLKSGAACIIFILLFFYKAVAQPTLPDIAGSADKGIVVLSWNCQYSNIKLIAVMRSADSSANYTTIGNVKNLSRGMQAFVDGHPAAGKNYYMLAIVFRSGLTWKSNHCSVSIDKALLASSMKLPANDSLQHFTVTEERATPAKTSTRSNTAIQAKSEQKNMSQQTSATDNTKHKIAVTFDQQVETPDIKNTTTRDTVRSLLPRHKVVISFGEPDANLALNIKSRYIYTDEQTGHVKMYLPDDVNRIAYSVQFYDADNKMIFEVPRIKTAKIIIDKRNFQRKGYYHFVLRKDDLELERGFVMVVPNP